MALATGARADRTPKAKDYSGDDYYRKSGKQVRAVAAMINELLLEEIFETPAE